MITEVMYEFRYLVLDSNAVMASVDLLLVGCDPRAGQTWYSWRPVGVFGDGGARMESIRVTRPVGLGAAYVEWAISQRWAAPLSYKVYGIMDRLLEELYKANCYGRGRTNSPRA